MDRPYTTDAMSSLSVDGVLAALAGDAAAPAPVVDAASDPCFPPSRDTQYMPALSPESGAPFQDVVVALEAAQRELGGAMLSHPREP